MNTVSILHKLKYVKNSCHPHIVTYRMLPQTANETLNNVHHPTNQAEFDQLIQSSPFNLVEIYSEWCGPCKCFKMGRMPQNCSFIQVPHGVVHRYTTSGTLVNRKNSCQPTFLLLDRASNLLHLQHGLVVSELRRLIHENVTSASKQSEWQANQGTTHHQQNHQHVTQQQQQQQQTGEQVQPVVVGRRSSMRVDSSELRRRNSMASTGLKNAFKSSNKRKASVVAVQAANAGVQEETTKSFNATMKGLNNIQAIT